MKLRKIRDGITPSLRSKLRAVSDRRPLLSIMGQAVKSLSQRAFTQAEFRPFTWAPRKVEPKDGHPILQESTLLRKGINVLSVSNRDVVIGSDRPYAAAHQLGAPSKNLPPRPYMPFTPDGKLTPAGQRNVNSALSAGLRKRGL